MNESRGHLNVIILINEAKIHSTCNVYHENVYIYL